MTLPNSVSSKTQITPPAATAQKIPRLVSLEHRLRHAKDADGQPIPLIDELLFFLEDPPAGTADRWQEGADLCATHGISTSRMAVWRFYRAHILQWRREQMPAPPAAPIDPQEIERLHDQARLLAAQRVLEMLNDPRLSPGQLIGLLQNENQREQRELARDQFHDRLDTRRRQEQRDHQQRSENQARLKALFPDPQEALRKAIAESRRVEPHPTL